MVGNAFCVPNPLVSIVSRKVHGAAGPFDINLPTSGTAAVEPRRGGADGEFTLIYTFNRAIGTLGTATSTNGSVNETVQAGPGDNQVTVNLTGVTNAQNLEVILEGVKDTAGLTLAAATARMGVLLGDINSDRSVNSADVTDARRNSGQVVLAQNFRTDVTTDGVINSADITGVRRGSGTALP